MSQDVELGCRCGKVHGWVRGVSPAVVNRVICYCDDCQAFLHQIGRADLLDAHGGTDIVQVAPRAVLYDRGTDCIEGLRLTPTGMYRWYASCCKTPLGNTVSPKIPFVGIGPEVFQGVTGIEHRDELFGAVRALSFGKFATGGAPEGSTKVNLKMVAHALRLILGWKLLGKTWPHPFFETGSRAPKYPLTILTAEEREALRGKCGPNPSVIAKPG